MTDAPSVRCSRCRRTGWSTWGPRARPARRRSALGGRFHRRGILPDVLEQRELSGGQPSALHQLALATFLSSHEYDRGVRRLRGHYRARRTRLEQVVADQLPGCEVTGLAAGLQCLLRLPMSR